MLPNKSLWAKASLGSSISFTMKYKGKQVGVKFTLVDKKHLVGTIRIPKGKKIGLLYFGDVSRREKSSSSKIRHQFSRKKGAKGSVLVDCKKVVISTNIKGVSISPVQYRNQGGDDLPSAEGFLGWLGDKISDAAIAIAAGITYLTDEFGTFTFSDGSVLEIDGGNGLIYTHFKSEGGMEEEPGVWY